MFAKERDVPLHTDDWRPQVTSFVLMSAFSSATAPEAAFPDRIARFLTFAEELHIRHDRLVGMFRLPVGNVCFVVGNADHEARGARAPIAGGACRAGRAVEQILTIALLTPNFVGVVPDYRLAHSSSSFNLFKSSPVRVLFRISCQTFLASFLEIGSSLVLRGNTRS
jgi:hypothetical protein